MIDSPLTHEDPQTIERFQKAKLSMVTREAGQKMAKEVGADLYLECSAKNGQGVVEVFQEACRASLYKKERGSNTVKPRRSGGCLMM